MLVVVVISFTYIGLSPFSTQHEIELEATGGTNAIRQLVFIAVFFLSSCCFYALGKLSDVKKILPFLLLCIWVVLSISWSAEPAISVRRLLLFLITASTVFMLVSIIRLDDMVDTLAYLLAALVIISVMSAFIVPGAVHTGTDFFGAGIDGNWKGVFYHKNAAGPATVFCIFLALQQYFKSHNYGWLLIVLLAIFFIYMTKSKTSMGLLVPSIMLGIFAVKVSAHRLYSKILALTITISVLLLLALSEQLVEAFIRIFNSPEAFTGRATIWELLYFAIVDNFWLGMGYGAVWSVGDGMKLADYARGWVEWVFTLTGGHSGYLDVFAALGVIGFVLSVWAFMLHPFLKLGAVGATSRSYLFFIFSTFAFFLGRNFLESGFLNADNGTWLCFLFCYFIYYIRVVGAK
ncbi:hypothetical protein WG68_02400 [Arsukibacterium ikkense]|uniref:O-antigen ligase-related domain-containing protein n=2 Tax=Arsukibacterium ikkense TaxID=336831 RepID=A0A0M2V878_9GAMM|nr:hypothetical protein WG68_02400 [Arsukibacterium ikkense]